MVSSTTHMPHSMVVSLSNCHCYSAIPFSKVVALPVYKPSIMYHTLPDPQQLSLHGMYHVLTFHMITPKPPYLSFLCSLLLVPVNISNSLKYCNGHNHHINSTLSLLSFTSYHRCSSLLSLSSWYLLSLNCSLFFNKTILSSCRAAISLSLNAHSRRSCSSIMCL